MQSRTREVETAKRTSFSHLNISNRDPAYDYSFQRKVEIAEAGGVHPMGWEAITESNNSGETLAAIPFIDKTRGSGNMQYHDTIACRRKKEITSLVKREEDERYNAQVMHVRNSARRTREALRDLDGESTVVDRSKFSGPGMTQRKGPTEKEI